MFSVYPQVTADDLSSVCLVLHLLCVNNINLHMGWLVEDLQVPQVTH